MRIILFILFFVALIIAPVFSFASDCDNKGVTIIYVNGIFGDKLSAQNDKDLLKYRFFNSVQREDVTFINGFNPSHLGGVGDLVKSVMQAYGNNSLDYDLTNILSQVHNELQTKKVLLVGHSQGTFYTNAAYDYLVENGVPKESIAVYNVATPADKVAGSGNYLTSSTDKVISSIVQELTKIGSAKKPLPPNIDILLEADEADSPVGGHSFSNVYLKSSPEKIIGDMEKELESLTENNSNNSAPDNGGCFTAPKLAFSHKIKNVVLAAGDISAGAIKTAADVVKKGVSETYGFGRRVLLNLVQVLNNSGVLGAALISSQSLSLPKNETDLAEAESYSDSAQTTQTDGQNSRAVDSEDLQEKLDDIAEKIDAIKRQLADLQVPDHEQIPAPNEQNLNDQNSNPEPKIQLAAQTESQNIVSASASVSSGGGGGGGSSSPVYPKILISEVQISGLTDEKQEFTELYNPNDIEIDLTGWYLQRKTKTGSDWSSFASSALFSGKKIMAKDYFLIARQDSDFTNSADIIVDNPLTEDNSLVLKNPNREISDKLGWGQAQEYETNAAQNPATGKSMGRRWVESAEQDTDNNSNDFETQEPTPKAGNVALAASADLPGPDLPGPVSDKTAPQVAFSLSPIQANLSFAVGFSLTDPFEVVSPSGLESYILRWKEDGKDWQTDPEQKVGENPGESPASSSFEKNFNGEDGKTYYFQAKAKDIQGNESGWLPETPAETKISLPKKILINEIQIDSIDGPGGTDDDWVELYNPNSADVSLAGWSMQRFGADSPCSLEKGYYKKNFPDEAVIKANSYFLLAGNQANDALKSLSDMTIGWSLTDNNTIYLVNDTDKISAPDDSNISDKAGYGSACFPETSAAVSPPDGKSIERKKLGQDTDDNSADFRVSEEPSPKAASPKISIKDATDYFSSMVSSNPGSFSYDLSIEWGANNSNIDFYQVQHKLNDENWQDWLSNTTETKATFRAPYSLFNDNVHGFRARAQDKDGNQGDWQEIAVDLTNPIVINEIGFMGTSADPKDQWLELYNRSNKDIDITGWKLATGSVFSLGLKGVIPANGYFVLESEDDQTLSDISAGQIFNHPLQKGYLRLYNKNNRQIDSVLIFPTGMNEDSFSQEPSKPFSSLERISPFSFGIDSKNWKINSGKAINGKDRGQNPVYGTPGGQNSLYQIYTPLSFSFIEDTTLKKSLSPYLISQSSVYVFKNITLTIEPGVVIKFFDFQTALTVQGTLKAIGTDSEKIIFTNFYDDEYGGDTNIDSGALQPYPGSWLGIYFSKDSVASELENVVVRYAGAFSGFSPSSWGTALWVDQSAVLLKNSIVEKNKNRGLLLADSSSKVDSVDFKDNDAENNNSRAVEIKGASPLIKNSRFSGSHCGIYIDIWHDSETDSDILATPVLENNAFEADVGIEIFDASNFK